MEMHPSFKFGGGEGNMDNSPVFDINTLRAFVKLCEQDKANYPSKNTEMLIGEGERIANEFRRLFPDVSDRDLGSMLIVFCQVLAIVSDTKLLNIANTLEKVVGSYSYAAANIAKSVIQIEDMTNDQ